MPGCGRACSPHSCEAGVTLLVVTTDRQVHTKPFQLERLKTLRLQKKQGSKESKLP
jgi:hypothetical protein